MAQILMSKDNPTGWKLEELLEQLSLELELKNLNLFGCEEEVLQEAVISNRLVAHHLERAIEIQKETMRSFAEASGKPEDPSKPRFVFKGNLEKGITLLRAIQNGSHPYMVSCHPGKELEVNCMRQGLITQKGTRLALTERGEKFLAWYDEEFPKCST